MWTGIALAIVFALATSLAVASTATAATAATAATQPSYCPPGLPKGVCDPAPPTDQPGTQPTATPAPGGSGFPDSCLPGSLVRCGPDADDRAGAAPPAASPQTSGTPTSTPAAPCAGPGCVPPAPASSAPPSAPATPGAATSQASSCGIFDLNACVDGFFRWIVGSALNPLLDLLSQTLLTTPRVAALPRVAELWGTSWQILVAVYALLVVVAGIVLMAYETLQTRYTIKELAPRIVAGFLAGAMSLWASARGIDLANGVSVAVAGDDVDVASAGAALRGIASNTSTGGITILLMGLVLAAMLVVLLLTYVVRLALVVILVAGAPLALMFHALPQTEGIARWWWKAYAATLAIQVAQSITLVAAIKVFLTPGGFTPFGATSNGLVNTLVAIALVYVLIKIPFWTLSMIRGGSGGRSMVGSLVRGAIAYKTFGLVGGSARRGRRTSVGPPSRTRRRDRVSEPGDDSRPRGRTDSDDRHVAPPRKRHPSMPIPPTPPKRRPNSSGRTTRPPLPRHEDRPQNDPILGPDGQYQLPLEGLRRVARLPTPPTPPAPQPRRGQGRQLKLPLRPPDPYVGIRPDRAGQYPLPFRAERAPKPPAPPPPPAPRRSDTAGRQLRLPLDLPAPPRRTAPNPPPASSRPRPGKGTP